MDPDLYQLSSDQKIELLLAMVIGLTSDLEKLSTELRPLLETFAQINHLLESKNPMELMGMLMGRG